VIFAISQVSSAPTDFKGEGCRTELEESKLKKTSRLVFFSSVSSLAFMKHF